MSNPDTSRAHHQHAPDHRHARGPHRSHTSQAQRLIAEGDFGVVQARGNVATKAGQRYDNSYCFVCRWQDGQVRELTEYMDTQLATIALGAP